MVSSFFGLHLASKALAVHQRAMETSGHNISNAYTQGYSRQIVTNTTDTPLQISQIGSGFMQIGSGVNVGEIARARDIFLDGQVRLQSWISGRWETKSEVLSQIEDYFAEPSDNGLSSNITRFLNSWQNLVNNPESTAIRSNIREQAVTFTNTLNDTYTAMAKLQADLNEHITVNIREANTYITEIANLNAQINEASAVGALPNDLMDKRDLLVDKLASLMDIRVTQAKNNQVNILIMGRTLVRENEATTLVADPGATGLDGQTRLVTLSWPPDDPLAVPPVYPPVNITDGKLKGLLDLRDVNIVDYVNKLNLMVEAIIEDFNTVHRQGFGLNGNDNIDFFEGTSARDIRVSQDILSDLANIAAAELNPVSASGPGDSGNAFKLAKLREAVTHTNPLSQLDGTTYQEYFAGIIAGLGIESAEAARMQDNQVFLLAQLEQRRQALSGVSIDEEMANMVMYQRSYEAAARVVTLMDEMLDTIINRMGLVGR